MSAYVILEIVVHDPERYKDYMKLAPPIVEQSGGKYLVRGGTAENLEGDWSPNRIVVLEFESAAQAKKWLESPEYREARALRHATSTTRAIVVEGL